MRLYLISLVLVVLLAICHAEYEVSLTLTYICLDSDCISCSVSVHHLLLKYCVTMDNTIPNTTLSGSKIIFPVNRKMKYQQLTVVICHLVGETLTDARYGTPNL